MSRKTLKKYGGTDANNTEYKYIVEKIDINGNGKFDDIDDGVLIKKYSYDRTNDKLIALISNTFVPNSKVDNTFKTLENDPDIKKIAPSKKSNIIYTEKQISNLETGKKQLPQNQYIAVQDTTSFGQNIQNGFSYGIGREGASLLMDALFSSDE